MRRVVTAAVLLPCLWLLIKRAPFWAFALVAGACIAVATWECYRLREHSGARPFKWLGLAACAALAWSAADPLPGFGVESPLAALVAVAALGAMARRDDAGSMLSTWIDTVFPVLFVGLMLAYTVRIGAIGGEDGQDLLLLLFGCVVASDTAAYYVGTWFGRRRLARRLSPKKSWEGAVGGLAAGMAVAWIAHAWFFQRLPLPHALTAGALLGVAGILGDLTESMVKRAAGVKDSSSLLPGHGGLLDRLDSVLFAGPVLYFYYWMFLEGAW